MGMAAMLDFRALGRRWPSGISGNGDNVLYHLKSKNGCSGGAPRVFLAPALEGGLAQTNSLKVVWLNSCYMTQPNNW